ncbi:hypothetical protein [Sphingopyxis sp. GW247-27LB]|uniref:hypothetical protein n=1 Tax=Sphingopyxis sp. GW247-27LB TaxID=2012632 RepID=UPI000BA72B26|nr:hypothetical protein [Sphingopyxis sp. GW247-27LB]PAL23551.1 hypothetical protein CD928_05650 [Sphingopyxis sp. GW247-27LB]
MRRVTIALPILLTACSTPTIVRDRVTPVSVPVIQPCASEKPGPIAPINQRNSQEQWNAMSHKQRAEVAAAQALRRLNHGAALAAATSAC